MTPKQKLFVKEYLVDLNATRAAIAAGYSGKTACEQGYRLLRNVQIQSEVNKSQQKRAEKLDISAEYVLKTIKETIERCRQAEPVLDRRGKQIYVETAEGELVPAFTFNALGVLKGSELLGKHLKLFTEKVEHSGAIEHNYHDYGNASDEQLRAWEEDLTTLEQVGSNKG